MPPELSETAYITNSCLLCKAFAPMGISVISGGNTRFIQIWICLLSKYKQDKKSNPKRDYKYPPKILVNCRILTQMTAYNYKSQRSSEGHLIHLLAENNPNVTHEWQVYVSSYEELSKGRKLWCPRKHVILSHWLLHPWIPTETSQIH